MPLTTYFWQLFDSFLIPSVSTGQSKYKNHERLIIVKSHDGLPTLDDFANKSSYILTGQ